MALWDAEMHYRMVCKDVRDYKTKWVREGIPFIVQDATLDG